MTDRSPFPYQGPLAPPQVSGRDELIADLAERLMDHRLTALLGPRRFGKTSVLRRVTADLAAVGPDTIWIDLYELNSMADLAVAVDRALHGVTGKVRKALSSTAVGLSVQLGVVGLELSRAARDRPDPVVALRSLLQVLVRTAEKHPLIVVLDEFSGIANVTGAAGLLRTELQHHYQEIGIVFAGSQPSTMRSLFGDQAQPFFSQADLIEIGPLDDAALTDIVERGFEETGREAGAWSPSGSCSSAAATRSGDADGRRRVAAHPRRRRGRRRHLVRRARHRPHQRRQRLERLYELIPTGQQKTLRAVVAGGSIYGAVADVLDLSPGTARGAVDALLGNGYMARRNDKLVVVDPLFADWIRRRFAP